MIICARCSGRYKPSGKSSRFLGQINRTVKKCDRVCPSCQLEIDNQIRLMKQASLQNEKELDAYSLYLSQKTNAEIKQWKTQKLKYKIRSLRRARIKESEGQHDLDYIEYLLVKQSKRCMACATDISDNYHVDHIYPLAKGGSNGKENIQLLCPTCNLKKHAQDPIEFLQSNGLNTYYQL